MDISKEGTYNRARQILQQDISSRVSSLKESFYLLDNYPFDIEGYDVSVDPDCSKDDTDQGIIDLDRKLLVSIRKLNSVRQDVEKMVSEIYDQMSEGHMSNEKIREIADLIHVFMKVTGEPWLGGFVQKKNSVIFYVTHGAET